MFLILWQTMNSGECKGGKSCVGTLPLWMWAVALLLCGLIAGVIVGLNLLLA